MTSKPFPSARAGLALLALCGAALLPTQADAAGLAPGSTVSAVFKQMNVPVTGQFKSFSGDVQFDPAHLDKSHANIVVETGSFDLGDPSFNENARGKDWLAAASFPKATFVSSAIQPAGAGSYKVSGKLTIRGKTVETSTVVKFQQQGAQQVFDGALPVHRLAVGVGQGEWADTSVVADLVELRFHLVTRGK